MNILTSIVDSIALMILQSIGTNDKRGIVIGGNIASGKSTIIELLESYYPNYVFLREDVEEWKESLENYYQNRTSENCKLLQLTILKTFQQIEEKYSNSTNILVAERSPYESLYVFIEANKTNLSESHYKELIDIFNQYLDNSPFWKSFHYLLLDVPDVQTLFQRIQQRPFVYGDNKITVEYLSTLSTHYKEYYHKMEQNQIPITKIEN